MPTTIGVAHFDLRWAGAGQRGRRHDHVADRSAIPGASVLRVAAVRAWLVTQGRVVNGNRVQRPLRLAGFAAIYRPNTSKPAPAKNLPLRARRRRRGSMPTSVDLTSLFRNAAADGAFQNFPFLYGKNGGDSASPIAGTRYPPVLPDPLSNICRIFAANPAKLKGFTISCTPGSSRPW